MRVALHLHACARGGGKRTPLRSLGSMNTYSLQGASSYPPSLRPTRDRTVLPLRKERTLPIVVFFTHERGGVRPETVDGPSASLCRTTL